MSEGDPSRHVTVQPPQPENRAAAAHVFVATDRGREPGLLIMWRREPDGWYGHVIHRLQQGHTRDVVQRWVRSDLIDQVDPLGDRFGRD